MLEKTYITHTGKEMDLSALSFEELQQLNLEEETYFARKIEEKPAFSQDRNQFSRQAYQKIFQIADWKRKETKKKGNGVTDQTIDLLKQIIKKTQVHNRTVLFYEAGVGKGEAVKQLMNENIIIRGCDIFLSEEAKELQENNPNLELIEENLYDALDKIEDNCVDIFYADNVLEHIVSDEFEETIGKIAKKIKKGGFAVFIIPNLYVGPSDISKIILPVGSKATGFHFMEQSFHTNLDTFKKYGMKPKYFCWRDRRLKRIFCIRDILALNIIKKKAEKSLGKISTINVRRKLFKRMAYEVYVLKK